MTDTNKLRSIIVGKGMTQGFVADKLGISHQSFSYKVNNKVEFKASEIETLCSLLEIKDKDSIFFA